MLAYYLAFYAIHIHHTFALEGTVGQGRLESKVWDLGHDAAGLVVAAALYYGSRMASLGHRRRQGSPCHRARPRSLGTSPRPGAIVVTRIARAPRGGRRALPREAGLYRRALAREAGLYTLVLLGRVDVYPLYFILYIDPIHGAKPEYTL
jgi:hypothetical protein